MEVVGANHLGQAVRKQGNAGPPGTQGGVCTSPPDGHTGKGPHREGGARSQGGGLRAGRGARQPVSNENRGTEGRGNLSVTPRGSGRGASSSGGLGRLGSPEEVAGDWDSDRTVPGRRKEVKATRYTRGLIVFPGGAAPACCHRRFWWLSRGAGRAYGRPPRDPLV